MNRLSRADIAVLALGLLGAGNLWARRGAGGGAHAAWTAVFIPGFAMVVVAGVLCLVAIGRRPALPRPIICSVGIAAPMLLVPSLTGHPHWLDVAAVVLAAVPLLPRGWMAWAAAVLGGAIVAATLVSAWTWGYAHIDVFQEVQGSTQALIHGQNPYAPVYAIYLDSPLNHPIYGSASFSYGPAVVLLSVPARLIGDVRLTLVALNIAILAAALVWLRRAWPGRGFGPTLAALWASSPFLLLMILSSWTDVYSFAAFAWWLVLRDRHRGWAMVCLAVALACKPTMLPLLVPLIFWVRSSWRELVRAACGALVIVAPFALWTGLPQFVYDTVSIYGDLPTRRDSTNLNGLSTVLGHGLVSLSPLLVATVATVVVFTVPRPRDYGDLLLAGAGMLVVALFFAKQAFINYDFNAAMALLLVIGGGALIPSTRLSNPVHELR
ncbi:MAG: glycosyltransferase 87 family protein, partial [Candidatus Dormibacteraeota bacterium]|nr:glycosyltransferase 87 family protein [Candidatus Dormibacteraeota bacterium]